MKRLDFVFESHCNNAVNFNSESLLFREYFAVCSQLFRGKIEREANNICSEIAIHSNFIGDVLMKKK